jgi:protein-S-isoprenylcysteine O-methyltransferase Ste14
LDRWYVGAAIYFVSVIVPYLLEQVAYSRYTPRPAEKQDKTAITGYGWAYVWDIAHFAVLIYAAYKMIFRTATLDVWDAVGVGVFIVGVVTRIWALRELGEFYDTDVAVRSAHEVVRSGPYRLLRHPLHMGTNLEIIGLATLAPWWLGIPAALSALLLTVYRNHFEDQVLKEHLGSAYAEYYAETWDPIDLIYWKPRR